jgi:hypothetical protein
MPAEEMCRYTKVMLSFDMNSARERERCAAR